MKTVLQGTLLSATFLFLSTFFPSAVLSEGLRSCSYDERTSCNAAAQILVASPAITIDTVVGALTNAGKMIANPITVFTNLDDRVDDMSESVEKRLEQADWVAQQCKELIYGCK